MLRCFAIGGAGLGSSGEIHIGAEGVRESRCYTRGEGGIERGDERCYAGGCDK